jgi:uncharacterized protein (DUF427 family)
MAKATWNGAVLADSDDTKVVEGNHYFPPDSVNWEYFSKNERNTVCPWKGIASYYDVEVEGKLNRSAAWYYPDPSSAAKQITSHVAFWNGVRIEKGGNGSSTSLVERIRNLFG